jgi:signal transduction histidine kinase
VLSPLTTAAARLPGTGSGLVGMRERAVMLAGTFDAGPDGEQWRVHAELPVDQRFAEAEREGRAS